jgi:hypothetical protein
LQIFSKPLSGFLHSVLQEKKKKKREEKEKKREAHLNLSAHLPSDHLSPIAFFFVRTSIRARHAPHLVDGTARRCSSLPIKSPLAEP